MSADDKKEYLFKVVNPILEKMVMNLAQKQPEDAVEFMIKWLQSYQNQHQRKQTESDEEEDDDIIDEAQLVKKKQINVQRASVSAEVFGQFNAKQEFVPIVHEKSREQKEQIRERLNKCFMFQHLHIDHQDIVIDAMLQQDFEQGQVIIQQGDQNGDSLYMVDQGELHCFKTIEGKDILVKQYFQNDVFGELALLYSVPRQASIIAQTKCTLWKLDRATFNNIVRDAAINQRQEFQNFLKNVQILEMLNNNQREQIVDAVKLIKFKQGQLVVKEGDKGDTFFILQKGTAYATKNINGEEKTVMNYKPGQYFGEIALLKENKQRKASIYAETEIVLLSLDRNSFKRLLGPIEDILEENLDNYTKGY